MRPLDPRTATEGQIAVIPHFDLKQSRDSQHDVDTITAKWVFQGYSGKTHFDNYEEPGNRKGFRPNFT